MTEDAEKVEKFAKMIDEGILKLKDKNNEQIEIPKQCTSLLKYNEVEYKTLKRVDYCKEDPEKIEEIIFT